MFSKSFLPGKLWWWDNRVGDTAQWVPTNPFLHSLLLRERAESEGWGGRWRERSRAATLQCFGQMWFPPKKIKFPSVASSCIQRIQYTAYSISLPPNTTGIWFYFNKEKHKSWAAGTETETSMLLKRNMKGYLRSIKNRIKYINWMMLTQSFKKIFSSFDIYICFAYCTLGTHAILSWRLFLRVLFLQIHPY